MYEQTSILNNSATRISISGINIGLAVWTKADRVVFHSDPDIGQSFSVDAGNLNDLIYNIDQVMTDDMVGNLVKDLYVDRLD
jgi:hypothetical protein